jgi:tetratricopeptide (TPR) repeat protein
MAMRYFNWKLAIVLVVASVVFGISVYALHHWQTSQKAEQALPRGLKAFDAKNWDEAADQLGRYISRNNQDVSVLVKYADAQMKRRPMSPGNIQQAIAAYRNALRFRPDDIDTARRLTQLYLDPHVQQWTQAAETAARHLEVKDDPALRRMLGDALWRLREFAKATTELKTIINKYPGEVLAYEFMGFVANARPETADRPAAAWFDEAVAKNPESALAYAVRAAYSLRQNDKDKALADLTRAVACDLSDTSVRFRVVEELIKAGAWEKAREQLKALQAIDPADPRLWQIWAVLALKTASLEEMFMVADEGMKATGESWDLISTATRLLIISGHLEKVEGYLARMREKDLDPAAQAFLAGLFAEKQGRLRDAVEDWQRSISLSPRATEEVYRRLASAFSRLGDTQSAINQLQIMLANRPALQGQEQGGASSQFEYVQPYLLLAQLFAQARNWPKVQELAQQVREIARNEPQIVMETTLLDLQARTHILATKPGAENKEQAWRDIETQLAELDTAANGAAAVKLLQIQVAMTQGKFADASSVISELEKKGPSDLRLLLVRAELCMAQGQNDQARTLYQNAVAGSPQAFEPVRGLAVFLDRQDQRAECESVLKEAIARFQEPQPRRDAGLLLAELYYRWQEKKKLCQWLTDLAGQFPNDIQSRRMLLACDSLLQDAARSQKDIDEIDARQKEIDARQKVIDEIKVLEGEKGSQWRYEQVRLWIRLYTQEVEKAAESQEGKGDTKKEFKNYAQTVKLLQENLLTNPEDQSSRLLLAGTYEMVGEQQLALTTYREAFDRTPNDTQVLVRLVAALHKAGEFDKAQEILDKAGQQESSNPDLQRLQVDNDFRRGDIDSASEALQQLVERDPNDAMLRLSYARVLVLRKEFAKAEALLTDLRAKTPDSILVIRAQLELCLQQGNIDKAIQICNEAVDQLHNATAYLLRVDLLIRLRQEAKAMEDLGQAIALEPKNVKTWEARARIYGSSGRIPEAVSDVRQALALAPQEPRIQKLAAALFIAVGKQSLLREAEDMLDKALAGPVGPQGKKDPELRVYKARILIIRGTGPAIEEARQLLRQVTTDYPKYADAWEWMARLELDREEPGRALDYATRGLAYNEQHKPLLLLKAIAEKRLSPSVAASTTLPSLAELYPEDVGILIEWADAYAQAGRPGKAVELLSRKLPDFKGPAHRRCEIALAAALYTDQQREKAKTLFDTLMAAEPNDPTPVMTLGQLLRKEKRWTEVNQLLNLWRTTNPKDAETATNMARILAGSGDKEALQMAEDQLRMILDPNPQAVPTLVLLGMLMQDAGRNEEATRLNRRILELDPNNVIAINNLAWMLCDQASPPAEAVKEALDLANRGLALVPDYMDLLDTRAVVYYRSGDMAKAEADLVKCLSLFPANSPQSAAPQFHLARTHAAMNRRTQAVEHLRIALNLNKKNVQLAKDHADVGRRTHAIKVLRDALSLQEEMDQFKTGFDPQDLADVRPAEDWTEARLLLDQLQKGR